MRPIRFNEEVYMRRSAATVGLVLAFTVSAPATAGAVAGPTQAVAHIACTSATINHQSKCIARGQFCSRKYASQYKRYGLSCTKRDARGRYHLT